MTSNSERELPYEFDLNDDIKSYTQLRREYWWAKAKVELTRSVRRSTAYYHYRWAKAKVERLERLMACYHIPLPEPLGDGHSDPWPKGDDSE